MRGGLMTHSTISTMRSGAGADCGWQKATTDDWHHRQSIRQNSGKRGLRGYDAGKKIKGRKRHILVDTLGLIWTVVVHPANEQDRDGAKKVLKKAKQTCRKMKRVYADGGYRGKLITWVKEMTGWNLEIVQRNDDVSGFAVLPKRWIVERTFAWLSRYRRLSKDYEYLPEVSESFIKLAMIHLMVRRLEAG